LRQWKRSDPGATSNASATSTACAMQRRIRDEHRMRDAAPHPRCSAASATSDERDPQWPHQGDAPATTSAAGSGRTTETLA
jgi:hypothetical protein